MELLFDWFRGEQTHPAQLCETRDVAKGRIESFKTALERSNFDTADAFLLIAIIGELTNNAFDHNLGKWQDQPGCLLLLPEKLIPPINVGIADRGQGIRASLQPVVPSKLTDQGAIELAFEKTISGRQPEKRGNGLKFVRSIVNGSPKRGLVAVSGRGFVGFGGLKIVDYEQAAKDLASENRIGTLYIIGWS